MITYMLLERLMELQKHHALRSRYDHEYFAPHVQHQTGTNNRSRSRLIVDSQRISLMVMHLRSSIQAAEAAEAAQPASLVTYWVSAHCSNSFLDGLLPSRLAKMRL